MRLIRPGTEGRGGDSAAAAPGVEAPAPSALRLAIFPGIVAWVALLALVVDAAEGGAISWRFRLLVIGLAIGVPLARAATELATRFEPDALVRRSLLGTRRIAWADVESVRYTPRGTRLIVADRHGRIALLVFADPSEGALGLFIRARLRAAGNPSAAEFEEPDAL